MQAAVEGGKEIETRVTCLLVGEYEPPQLQTSTKDWAIALVISLESDDQNYRRIGLTTTNFGSSKPNAGLPDPNAMTNWFADAVEQDIKLI